MLVNHLVYFTLNGEVLFPPFVCRAWEDFHGLVNASGGR